LTAVQHSDPATDPFNGEPGIGSAAASLDLLGAEVAAGRPVLIINPASDDGSLVLAADRVTEANMAFLVRHSSGFVCVAITPESAERLCLPPMAGGDTGNAGGDALGYCVTVDADEGISTGISAHDRALTARLLANASTTALHFLRPGHVVPVRACLDGDPASPAPVGHAQAALRVVTRAAAAPAAVYALLVSEEHPTELAGPAELARFAARHGIRSVQLDELTP
jgi:3,4-dihydroxy 2-butanone 4-phosphate synthase/GTP cyclohydrolase II